MFREPRKMVEDISDLVCVEWTMPFQPSSSHQSCLKPWRLCVPWLPIRMLRMRSAGL